jgi:hypothetical protein
MHKTLIRVVRCPYFFSKEIEEERQLSLTRRTSRSTVHNISFFNVVCGVNNMCFEKLIVGEIIIIYLSNYLPC